MKKGKTKTKKQEGVSFTKEQFNVMLEGFFDQINDKVLDLVFSDSERRNLLISDMLDFIAQKVVNEMKFPFDDKLFKEKIAEIMNQEGSGMAQSLIFSQVEDIAANPEKCSGMCDDCKCKAKSETKTELFGHTDFDKTRGLN